jgi:Tol biopolymer transport system component
VTELVSMATNGTQGDANTQDEPSISADGRFVAFCSAAANLVAGDTNAVVDAFVHDRQTGATERVSVANDGTQANSASFGTSISGDGRRVCFTTDATNLGGFPDAFWDVFVRTRW